MDDLAQYASIRQAAEICGIPHSSLALAVRRGDVPSHALAGGQAVVRLRDVQEWDKTRRVRKSDSTV